LECTSRIGDRTKSHSTDAFYCRYNVTVKSGLYAKYYFELRALFKDNEAEFPLTPLDNQQAMELELRSGELQKQEKSKAERLSLTQQAGTQKKANFVLN